MNANIFINGISSYTIVARDFHWVFALSSKQSTLNRPRENISIVREAEWYSGCTRARSERGRLLRATALAEYTDQFASQLSVEETNGGSPSLSL